jgi:hypothetical protein
MMNILNDQDLEAIMKMGDRALVRHAGSSDLAVLVLANVRLRKSTERLTVVLILLTLVLVVLALPLAVEAYPHLKWW